MIAVELMSRRRSADATGPCGSSMPVCAQDATGTPAPTTSQPSHPEPLTEGLPYNGGTNSRSSCASVPTMQSSSPIGAFDNPPSASVRLRFDQHRDKAEGAP